MCDPTRTPRTTCGSEQFVGELTLAMRRATHDDIDQLCCWEHASHVAPVIGAGPGWDWENEISVDWQEVWIAEIGVAKRPIGVAILLDASNDPASYWGSVAPGTFAIDIWIGAPDAIRQGYGTEMMHFVIARALDAHDAHRIVIDPLSSNSAAIAFYQSLGFRKLGPRMFDGELCTVMEWRSPPTSGK